ncbi:MAG TPA: hypothetical protein VIY49_05720 [Bryobacteraceae bacterium]
MMRRPQYREPRVFVLEALAVIYSFTAAAFDSDWPSISSAPGGLVRLALPAATVLIVFWLRDAYADPLNRRPSAAAVDAISAYGLVFVLQMILSALRPELALPRWAPTQGGLVGFWIVVACRSLFQPRADRLPKAGLLSAEEIRWKSEELARKGGHRTGGYLAFCALLSILALWAVPTGGLVARAGWCLILTGNLVLIYRILKQHFTPFGGLGGGFDAYRRNLRRPHAVLQGAGYWFYGALLPGVLLLLKGSFVYVYWFPLVVLIAAELNRRAAGRLLDDMKEIEVPCYVHTE